MDEQKAVQTEAETTTPPEADAPAREKPNTFTQEDVNRFLARERRKWEKEQQKAGQDAAQAQEQTDDAELTRLTAELQTARAQLEAFRLDIRSDMVDDAVYLALREAEAEGGDGAQSMQEALKAVIKRHPDWKKEDKQKGGIKVGAVSESETAKHNQALPEGRVIF